MSNVLGLEQSCGYYVERARRHRLAGRYDEAMALLTKARGQFGPRDALEMETARVYEAMACGEEAARAYLRVVRGRGPREARALLRLAHLALRQEDLRRARAYCDRLAGTDKRGVSGEEIRALRGRMERREERMGFCTRESWALRLQCRAIDHIRAGAIYAALRALERALTLSPSAHAHMLASSCALLLGDAQEALAHALRACKLAPERAQPLCALADALHAAGREEEGRKAAAAAAQAAREPDELLAAAMLAAKRGEDAAALRLTQALLAAEPFHTQGMMLHAGALANLGRVKEASRLFGRLCGLLPENAACDYYYRLTRDGARPPERLCACFDVPQDEAARRGRRLFAALGAPPGGQEERELCRICAWALRSPLAGEGVCDAALLLLGRMRASAAREALMDAMTNPALPDAVKRGATAALMSREDACACDVDLGGRLLRATADGMPDRDVRRARARTKEKP